MSIREFKPSLTDADVAVALRDPGENGRRPRTAHMRFVEAKWAFRDSWKVLVAGTVLLSGAGTLIANGISGWLVTGMAIVGGLFLLGSLPTLLWGLVRAATRKSTTGEKSPQEAMLTYYQFALDRPLRAYALVAPEVRAAAGGEPKAFETEWRAAREVIADSITPMDSVTCSTCDAAEGPGLWTTETYGVASAGDDFNTYLRCPGCESVFCWSCVQKMRGFLNKKCDSCGHKLGKGSYLFVTDVRPQFTIGSGHAGVVAENDHHVDLVFEVLATPTYRLPWLVEGRGITRSGMFGGSRPDFDTPSIGDRLVGAFTFVMGSGGAPKVVEEALEPSAIEGGAVALRFHNSAVKHDDGWHLVAHEPGRMSIVEGEERLAAAN
ncbi:MAG: hypothetical protein HKN80_02930 [Acidimicrobiia bacterium]|nr:hypothetical protein [Acidimicrobiia bacterium]